MSEPFSFPEPGDDKIPASWAKSPPWKEDPDLSDLVEVMQPLERDYWSEGGEPHEEREVFLARIEARWKLWRDIAWQRIGRRREKPSLDLTSLVRKIAEDAAKPSNVPRPEPEQSEDAPNKVSSAIDDKDSDWPPKGNVAYTRGWEPGDPIPPKRITLNDGIAYESEAHSTPPETDQEELTGVFRDIQPSTEKAQPDTGGESDKQEPTNEELLEFMSAKTKETWRRTDLTPQDRARIWQGNKKLWRAAHKVRAETKDTGTRVLGQTACESDHERKQREQRQAESEVVATMHAMHREKYNDPNTPNDQRNVIFQTYKDKLEERKSREAAEFRRRLARIAEAQDWLQTIKDDPKKTHIQRPADDSEEELLKWHEYMQRPADHVPFPTLSERQVSHGDRRVESSRDPDRLPAKGGSESDMVASPPPPITTSKDAQPTINHTTRNPIVAAFLGVVGSMILEELHVPLPLTVPFWVLLALCLWQWPRIVKSKRRQVVFWILAGFYSLVIIGVIIAGQIPKTAKEKTPTLRIGETEVATARLKHWGTRGNLDVYVVLNASEFLGLADRYELIMICRAQDNTIDFMDDIRIDRSARYSIQQTDQTLQLTLSQDTGRRLMPEGWINFYVLLIPKTVNSGEIRTIREFIQNGAHMISKPSMKVQPKFGEPTKAQR